MRWTSLAGSAASSLRQSPLRTFLSVLGLVIGVASLVAILSMVDGMERYARDQIEATTDLQTVAVVPLTSEWVDGVRLDRDPAASFAPSDAAALEAALGGQGAVALLQQRPVEVRLDTARTAVRLTAAEGALGRWLEVAGGRLFRPGETAVVVSASLAERLSAGAGVVGRAVALGDVEVRVVGVLDGPVDGPQQAYGPYRVFADSAAGPPTMTVHVGRAEDVAGVASQARTWLDGRGGRDAFEVVSYEERAEQVRQGMLLFKLVMGLITGISVVVGGVGVMNVLLMTVTERTREIGVRKAVGARRRDVVAQFLAEAVAVSGVGSAVGLGLGLAVAVGVAFGTYPALRAARLRPVEAIRHE